MSSGRLLLILLEAIGALIMAIGFLIMGVAFVSALSFAVNGTELVNDTVLLAILGAMPTIIGAFIIDLLLEVEDG